MSFTPKRIVCACHYLVCRHPARSLQLFPCHLKATAPYAVSLCTKSTASAQWAEERSAFGTNRIQFRSQLGHKQESHRAHSLVVVKMAGRLRSGAPLNLCKWQNGCHLHSMRKLVFNDAKMTDPKNGGKCSGAGAFQTYCICKLF